MITVHFLAEWAFRSSILILAGAVLLQALRVQDPAVRLAAWTATLCGSLAIPLLAVSLPAMPVRTRSAPIPPAPAYHVRNARVGATYRFEAPAAAPPERFDWTRVAVDGYLAAAGLLLFRFALGFAMSVRLLRGSRATDMAGVRQSERVTSPVTLGIWRPVVVLPADWREWDAARLDAVLAHERSHIRRRDPAVQALSAIHRALLWYSPLSWYLHRQIVRLAEDVSDDAALAAVDDRASYAETLLAFMQRGVQRESWQGVPMARYGQPENRIYRILDATTLSRGITHWTLAAIVLLGMPLAYVVAAAQERLTFEAASVKPATPPSGIIVVGTTMTTAEGTDVSRYHSTGGPGTDDPGRIHYPLVGLTGLLKRAYPGYFDIKAPDWADTDILSVDATMPPTTTKEQLQKMLQNLLIDRFKLKTHVETKEIAGYALTVAKDGPKCKEARPENEPESPHDTAQESRDGWPVTPPNMRGIAGEFGPGERFRLVGPRATMAELAVRLGDMLDSVVEDSTGLKAAYDITVAFAAQHIGGRHGSSALLQPPPPSADPSAPEPQPDIFGALQSQLGLKLEKRKVSVRNLVVDHIERTPTQN